MRDSIKFVLASMLGAAIVLAVVAMGGMQPVAPPPADVPKVVAPAQSDSIDALYDSLRYMHGQARPTIPALASAYDAELQRRKAVGDTYDYANDESEMKKSYEDTMSKAGVIHTRDQAAAAYRLAKFERKEDENMGVGNAVVTASAPENGFVVVVCKNGTAFVVNQDGAASVVN